jgi:acyl carrier protein
MVPRSRQDHKADLTNGEGGELVMNNDDNRQGQAVAKPETHSATASALKERPELTNAYLAPQTTLHEVLLTVWAGILHIEKIGIQDNIFELGGDSILATQIISRLRDMFRMDIPASILFDAPTIEELAHYMIANEKRPGLVEKTAVLLKQIEGMSEEEVARLLRSK